jgi:hypothetical protein
MPLPTHVLNEIARLMRDPDALRHEREYMPRFDRRGHYNPNQPRVPAGNSDGGQWTDANGTNDGSNHGRGIDPSIVQPARLRLFRRPIQRPPNQPGIQRGIEAVLALFAALSARNTPEQRTIFDFNAREFLRDPHSALDPRNVTLLTQREVENVCKKLSDVQERTDRIASAVRADSPDLSPQQFGTAVHALVAGEINGRRPDRRPVDPNYRAEVSYSKMAEDKVSGLAGSIRIDVLERTKNDDVCVYDLKTGTSRGNVLTLSRMTEIAKNVLGAYPETRRIIITEVRPRR